MRLPTLVFTILCLALALAVDPDNDYLEVDYNDLATNAMCYVTLDNARSTNSVSADVGRYFASTALPDTFRVACFDPQVAYEDDVTAAKIMSMETLR
ncbi:hypothetical protein KIPB_012144, partial [Kipferlia bialata]|eukprot:g12144.t1